MSSSSSWIKQQKTEKEQGLSEKPQQQVPEKTNLNGKENNTTRTEQVEMPVHLRRTWPDPSEDSRVAIWGTGKSVCSRPQGPIKNFPLLPQVQGKGSVSL